MRRRSGQRGYVLRRGDTWYVRFWVDVPGQEERIRKSAPVGPALGKERLTKAEAMRRGAEIVDSFGVNTAAHLARAMHPESVQTVRQRADWCRRYHKAWTEGKPGAILSMESHLNKHLLPRLGDLPLEAVTETRVQEFVADLRRATFERRKRDGTVVKTYKLSRKTILNVVGVLKLLVGRKVWIAWELDLGKAPRVRQRYYTEREMARIIEAASGQFRLVCLVLAATGMRLGEVIGLHVDDVDLDGGVIQVRRTVWAGREQVPKTDAAVRVIDVDDSLIAMLRDWIGDRKEGLLFATGKGTHLEPGNLRRRFLAPLLKRLGIPPGGFHAWRHGRLTVLRKAGVPADLQKQWIGHSSLRTGDRYSHTDQEREFRKNAASLVGIGRLVGPNGPKPTSGEAA